MDMVLASWMYFMCGADNVLLVLHVENVFQQGCLHRLWLLITRHLSFFLRTGDQEALRLVHISIHTKITQTKRFL